MCTAGIDKRLFSPVAVRSTTRRRPALRAATLPLRSASVRFQQPGSLGFPTEYFPEGQPLTRAHHRQLVREGEAQKGYRHRPHALPQHSLEEVQERLPDRRSQGLCRPRDLHCFIIGYHDGRGRGRGRWDGSFSASGVTGAGHFSDGPTRFSLLHHKWHDFARDSVQRSTHRAKVIMKNGVTFGTNHTDSFLGEFRVKGRGRRSLKVQPRPAPATVQTTPSLQQAGG